MGEEWRLLIDMDADGALAPAADGIVAELGEEIGLHRADDDDDTTEQPAGTGPRTVAVPEDAESLVAELEARAPDAEVAISE